MKKLFALILAMTLAASATFAQQFGIVDFQRASQNYWKVVAEQKSLMEQQQHFAELQQQIKGRIDQLTKDMNAANEDAQNPGLSDERRAQAQQLADSKNQEIMQQSQSFQMQYQGVQRRLQQNQALIQADILASISKIARKNNLDMVFYVDAAPYGKIDITDEVITDLNSTEPAAAPAEAAQ